MTLSRRDAAGLLLLFTVLRMAGLQAYRIAVSPAGFYGIDFLAFYQAAQRLTVNGLLYRDTIGRPYLFSPLLAMALRPLSRLPFDHAFHLWCLVTVPAVLLSALLMAHLLGATIKSLHLACLFLITAVAFWPSVCELGIGNAEPLTLVVAVGMIVADHYRKPALAAMAMALLVLIKTWMLGMILYFVFRRQWRALALALGLTAAALAIMLGSIPDAWPAFFTTQLEHSVQTNAVAHSIVGVTRMFLSSQTPVYPIVDSPVLRWAVIMALYAVLGWGCWRVWRTPGTWNSYRMCLTLSFLLQTLLLGVPVCHQYYYLLALPAMWTLVVGPHGGRGPMGLAACIGMGTYLILSWPIPGEDPLFPYLFHLPGSLALLLTFGCGASLWFMCLRSLSDTDETGFPEHCCPTSTLPPGESLLPVTGT